VAHSRKVSSNQVQDRAETAHYKNYPVQCSKGVRHPAQCFIKRVAAAGKPVQQQKKNPTTQPNQIAYRKINMGDIVGTVAKV